MLTRFERFLEEFGDWQWVRKLLGGRWELWYLDAPICSALWFRVRHRFEVHTPEGRYGFTITSSSHPHPLARGNPIAFEEW